MSKGIYLFDGGVLVAVFLIIVVANLLSTANEKKGAVTVRPASEQNNNRLRD